MARAPTTFTLGRFLVSRKAAEGAAGYVYDAHDGAGARVALKVAKPGAEAIVAREGELLERLVSRWTPALIERGELDDRGRRATFAALAWQEGAPLDEALGRAKNRTELALFVGHAVASALAELHEANAVHGDVKPSNILVTEHRPTSTAASDRAATLVDFSLAVRAADSIAGATPRYVSPDAGTIASPERDVYALGVVLSEIAAAAMHDGSALGALVHAMTARAPGARPPASYVAGEIARIAGLSKDEGDAIEARRATVRRTHAAARAGADAELTRLRWLVTMIGPAAAAFATEDIDDAALLDRALALSESMPPAAFTERDLRGKEAGSAIAAATDVASPIALVAALSSGRADDRAIDRAEFFVRKGDAPAELASALASLLVRRGDSARAAVLLASADDGDRLSWAAEARRRNGDREGAITAAKSVIDRAHAGAESIARARYVLARCAWDAGAIEDAARGVEQLAPADATEIAALCHYARGEAQEGIALVTRAIARDGADARLYGLRGMLAHARGDAAAALSDFEHAVELAVRARAVVDEATYRTGEAAAAIDAGDLGHGFSASTRAIVLADRIGKRGLAARGWLSRAAVFLISQATFEAIAAAEEAKSRAIQAGDARCEVYADFTKLECMPLGAEGRAALAEDVLRRARSLGDDDALRALARTEHFTGALLQEAERWEPHASAAARLEYWGQRARHAKESLQDARIIIGALSRLADVRAPAGIRAVAWDHARDLAARVGDGTAARKFELLLSEPREAISRSVPAAYKGRLISAPFMKRREEDGAAALPSAKLAELFTITRALGARDSLRELCEMTLDAMVLWSGVERGLLLLPAPDGTLKVRAARNVRRQDLREGDTRRLSMGMAERAFATREIVVAEDAWATHSDMHASVHALGLRSVLAVPLVARGEVAGVVYLDDRQKRGAFGRDELAWVELIAGLAAMALRDARDQALLRRATRKAERARAHVTSLLADREKELFQVTERLAQAEGPRVPGIVGDSAPLKELSALVHRVGKSDVPVLVLGESGTGKELVARAIASSGARKGRAFLSENCASLPEPLLESTLFGHVKGAFTGAVSARVGLFDVADGGTLFLDEIGEMPPAMQVKLLRVLQDGEVRPVGSNKSHKVDVRIVCATHRDLAKMVAEGTFREDLFYRLNVVSLRVPPLRERREDIPLLVAHFLEKYAPDKSVKVAPAAMRRLASFPWPGNVRQLENEVRRAVVLAEGTIDEQVLSDEITRTKPSSGGNLRARIDELEADALKDALRRTRGNQTKAAALLGLSRFGLQKMMKRLGIVSEGSP